MLRLYENVYVCRSLEGENDNFIKYIERDLVIYLLCIVCFEY